MNNQSSGRYFWFPRQHVFVSMYGTSIEVVKSCFNSLRSYSTISFLISVINTIWLHLGYSYAHNLYTHTTLFLSITYSSDTLYIRVCTYSKHILFLRTVILYNCTNYYIQVIILFSHSKPEPK